MYAIFWISLTSCLLTAAGQIIFPGQEEEDAIRRSLNLHAETRNMFNNNAFGPCLLSGNRFGECLPYSRCSELKTLVGRNGLSSNIISLLRSRLCEADDSDSLSNMISRVTPSSFKLCCSTERDQFVPVPEPPPTVPVPSTRPFIPRNPAANVNLIPSEDDCGFATTNRIIQGEKFPHGSQPWLVGLGTLSPRGTFQLQCGGALITRRHILSASHCFSAQTGGNQMTHAIMGEHSLSKDTERERPVIGRIVRKTNPGYNSRSHVNDIELIELEEDLQFTAYIRPVCLPFGFENEEFIGDSMTILGWGDTFFRSMSGSDIPLKAQVTIIPRHECNVAYDRSAVINIGREQICASSVDRDACQGDSGGPFIFEGRRSYLIGIVSFGVDCAGGTFPGVYTFVPHYLKWIQANL